MVKIKLNTKVKLFIYNKSFKNRTVKEIERKNKLLVI